MDAICRVNGFLGWKYVSAKDHINVRESVSELVQAMITRREETQGRIGITEGPRTEIQALEQNAQTDESSANKTDHAPSLLRRLWCCGCARR